MSKLVSTEELLDRYAESALVSAVRLRRYWLSQDVSESVAIDRAVRQAAGMMAASGLSVDRLIDLFGDLKSACDGFVEMLHEIEGPG